MSEEVISLPQGKVTVTRYAGPQVEHMDRRMYQVTIYGETDNCGKRHAWVSLTPRELEMLTMALYFECGS